MQAITVVVVVAMGAGAPLDDDEGTPPLTDESETDLEVVAYDERVDCSGWCGGYQSYGIAEASEQAVIPRALPGGHVRRWRRGVAHGQDPLLHCV